VHGTSTRKVDDLVRALGVEAGISKSEVSRICAELDGEVGAFRSRSLAHTCFPYLFVDATYLKARVDGRVVSRAVVIATGVTADGGREVLGLDVGDSEDGAFWTAFLRSLKARGLAGVQLVISDAHTGLKAAIAAVMAGAAWQRCRVHFLRNVLARVPKGSAEMVAAAIRTIFAQPTGAEVIEQVDKVAAMLAPKFPAVATMLLDAREDLTAFAGFPPAHWTKIWSTNPLERLNKEVKRRTNAVTIANVSNRPGTRRADIQQRPGGLAAPQLAAGGRAYLAAAALVSAAFARACRPAAGKARDIHASSGHPGHHLRACAG
jgi:putative transposase